MKKLIIALLLTAPIAKAQVCDQAKSDLDKAVAAVKLSCVEKVAAPSPTPTPTPTPAPIGFTKCADEGGTCKFEGTRNVRYGVAGKWAPYKTAAGSIACTNAVFGDPAVGTAKICEYSSLVLEPSPAPSPTPFPAPPISTGSGIYINSKEYGSLAEAGAAYGDGDTIKITKSLVDEATALVRPGKVTVECSPGVKLEWKSGVNKRLAWGKGVFNVEGDATHVTIKNCEISGAQIAHSQGGNGAAVRLISGKIQEAHFINVHFHSNNNGILGAAKVMSISDSKFHTNGAGPDQDGHTHNVYIDTFADQVTVKNSYFGPVYMGNVFKSRAKNLTITGSTFESKSTTNSSYLLDIPNAGGAKITHNVFVKAPNQGQRHIFSYGVEGVPSDGRPNGPYELAHNIIVADADSIFMNGSGQFNFHDNTLVGPMSGVTPQTGSKVFKTRAEAGLAAAPAVPAVPSVGIMGFFRNLF